MTTHTYEVGVIESKRVLFIVTARGPDAAMEKVEKVLRGERKDAAVEAQWLDVVPDIEVSSVKRII